MHRGTNCCHMASTLIPEQRMLCFVTLLFASIRSRGCLFNELQHVWNSSIVHIQILSLDPVKIHKNHPKMKITIYHLSSLMLEFEVVENQLVNHSK